MNIPNLNTAELTEKMQFRVTKPLKQAVRHVMAEELANEQAVANHLLRLGVDAYEAATGASTRKRRVS